MCVCHGLIRQQTLEHMAAAAVMRLVSAKKITNVFIISYDEYEDVTFRQNNNYIYIFMTV